MALNPNEIKKINELYQQLDQKDVTIAGLQKEVDFLKEVVVSKLDNLLDSSKSAKAKKVAS